MKCIFTTLSYHTKRWTSETDAKKFSQRQIIPVFKVTYFTSRHIVYVTFRLDGFYLICAGNNKNLSEGYTHLLFKLRATYSAKGSIGFCINVSKKYAYHWHDALCNVCMTDHMWQNSTNNFAKVPRY